MCLNPVHHKEQQRNTNHSRQHHCLYQFPSQGGTPFISPVIMWWRRLENYFKNGGAQISQYNQLISSCHSYFCPFARFGFRCEVMAKNEHFDYQQRSFGEDQFDCFQASGHFFSIKFKVDFANWPLVLERLPSKAVFDTKCPDNWTSA